MADPFASFGLKLARWRWAVLAIWVIGIALAGGLLAPRASLAVKGGGFNVPDSESLQAARILGDDFNASSSNNLVVVYRSSVQTVDDPGYRNEVTGATARMAALPHIRSVLTFFNTGDPSLISQDRQTTVALVSVEGDEGEVQEQVPKLRDTITNLSIEHSITGFPAINHDSFVTSEQDLSRSEVFTIPIVVILLVIVFRTVVASAIPLILGACSVVLAMAVIAPIAWRLDTSIFALNVASMIGLGLAIDFSLIVVSRFRDELAAGRDTPAALAITMATAGRSITYSGITVLLAMGVLTLLLLNLMIVRSISLGVMIVAFTSLLAGLTLLPAILAILGPRVEWLRVLPRSKPPAPGTGPSGGHEGIWYRLSHAIMRRPWLWLVASLAVLLAIASPVRDLRMVGSDAGLLPPTTESVRGVRALNDAFGANRLTPIQIVLKTGPAGVWQPEFLDGLRQLHEIVKADKRSRDVASLYSLAQAANVPPEQFRSLTPDAFKADPIRARAAARFVNLAGDNDAAVVIVDSPFGQYEKEHQDFIYDLRQKIIPGIRQLRGAEVSVGGEAASFLDFRDALYGRFPIVAAAVMALIFVILMMFFQSVYLPLKAIFMNVVSILATYGALVVIFQYGVGANLFGFEALGKIGVITPAILFTILFALSTDYEVFMLSRVKEYYHETGNNEEAVAAGLEHTAGLITAAGLILIGTFGSFASANIVTIKEIGLGLAIGVFLDSTIVRVIMVPATMRLMGARNWWMPAWLKKIVPELKEGPGPALAIAGAAPASSRAEPAGAGPSGATVATSGQGAFSAVYPPRVTDEAEPVAEPVTGPAEGPAEAAPIHLVGQLRAVGGSVGTDIIALSQRRPLLIGRDPSNHLQLFDLRVAPFHARIIFEDGIYRIIDLNTPTGIYVNDQRIAPAPASTPLSPGDVIEIGDIGILTFIFELRSVGQLFAVKGSI